MKIEEVYNYFDKNWQLAARRIGISNSSLYNYRNRGGIPMLTQRKIEEATKGKLVASWDDVGSYKG